MVPSPPFQVLSLPDGSTPEEWAIWMDGPNFAPRLLLLGVPWTLEGLELVQQGVRRWGRVYVLPRLGQDPNTMGILDYCAVPNLWLLCPRRVVGSAGYDPLVAGLPLYPDARGWEPERLDEAVPFRPRGADQRTWLVDQRHVERGWLRSLLPTRRLSVVVSEFPPHSVCARGYAEASLRTDQEVETTLDYELSLAAPLLWIYRRSESSFAWTHAGLSLVCCSGQGLLSLSPPHFPGDSFHVDS